MSEAQSMTLEDRMAAFELDPSNPEALASLEKAAMGEAAPAEVAPAAVEAKTEEPAAKTDEKQEPGEASIVETPQGVQAKDGQHIIPYSVLERERDRATRAEQTAQALTARIQQLESGKPAAASEAGEANAGAMTEEDLAQLDQDLPGVAKMLRAQMATISALTGTVQNLKNEQEVQAQNREQSQQDEIEVAISANPDLTAWRDAMNRADKPDPLMWNRAADLDASLREDPEWKDKPVAERFARVAATVKTLYGAPAAPAPQQQQQQPDLKAVADAKLKGLPAVMPQTLSDIPGGAPPASTDIENVESASSVALGNKFQSMSPAQIESWIARNTRSAA